MQSGGRGFHHLAFPMNGGENCNIKAGGCGGENPSNWEFLGIPSAGALEFLGIPSAGALGSSGVHSRDTVAIQSRYSRDSVAIQSRLGFSHVLCVSCFRDQKH